MTDREPWTRQKGESHKAYQAFCLYRDFGPTRSSRKVAETLSKSETLIRGWCSKWGWVDRAAEYDAHLDQIAVQEEEEARRKASKERREIIAALKGLSRGELNKMLKAFREEKDVIKTTSDILRVLDFVFKEERIEFKEDVTRIEHSGSDGGPIRFVTVTEQTRDAPEIRPMVEILPDES